MQPEAKSGGRFLVGPYKVDLEKRRVTRDGAEVDVSPTSMGVLEALILSHPHPLSTNALLERAWAGRVVNRETVKQQIRRIREQMTGPDGSKIIENRRGHGYYLPELTKVTERLKLRASLVIAAAAVVILTSIVLFALRPGYSDLRLPIVVAVLPFQDFSSDSGHRARVLQESLIHAIASRTVASRVRVISRSALEPTLPGDSSPAVQAELLGADFLFEGSINDLADGTHEVRARFIFIPRSYSAWEAEFILPDVSAESFKPVGEDIAQFLIRKAEWVESRG